MLYPLALYDSFDDKNRLSREFSGAVEATASTGGQIMPPIMVQLLFMTEYVGVNYGTVALAGVVPALLYFTGIFTNVHLRL